ncbi:NAD-dependent epimerase/dehydratase family protein [Bacillus sp. DJP31]|uniref:NAD-dependent epimerase/dehydratase family protein n=1 Tax=Bacillus sp. DJP31 TaxID=3409789 RepID=UPI003BB5F425
MKAVVTGGAGFIGSHLVDELISKGFDVHVIDNLTSGCIKNVHSQAVLHIEDIRSLEARKVIFEVRPDVVFHLAAQADVGKSIKEPNYDASVNINGTINILEASYLADVKKFVFASTSAVYGEFKTDLVSENEATLPISYYGVSKLAAESYVRLFYDLYQMSYTILRFGNVYGPRQLPKGEGGVVAVFIDRLKNGEPLTIYGDGEQTRDFIFVNDVVRANLSAINRGHQEILNVSTSRRISINQLIHLLSEIHGNKIETVKALRKEGDILHSCLNNKKAIISLDWNPSFFIYRGLEETYVYKVRRG